MSRDNIGNHVAELTLRDHEAHYPPMTLSSTSSLDEILNAWREEAAASTYSRERIKGTAFERLCIAYLAHDPTQQTQVEHPVPYADWAQERGLPQTDSGIDLVAKVRGGEGWCAIQCKFRVEGCLLYTSPSPRDRTRSRMPSSA